MGICVVCGFAIKVKMYFQAKVTRRITYFLARPNKTHPQTKLHYRKC